MNDESSHDTNAPRADAKPPTDAAALDSAGNATGDPAQQSPWKSRAVLTLVVAALLALATDLLSKSLAFKHIADAPVIVNREAVLAASPDLRGLVPFHDPVVVVPKLLNFTLVLNPGAVFGMGAGKRIFFVLFTLLAVPFALWVFGSWTRARDRWAHVGIGMMLGGGLGNLFDRIVHGCVRDFIHPLPGVEWPFGWSTPFGGGTEIWPYVSNLADLWLIIGIGLLLVHLWRGGKTHAGVQEAAT